MSALDEFYDEIVELKAELAALKARRCDGCEHWGGPDNTFCIGYGVCLGEPYEKFPPGVDFCCKLWEATA